MKSKTNESISKSKSNKSVFRHSEPKEQHKLGSESLLEIKHDSIQTGQRSEKRAKRQQGGKARLHTGLKEKWLYRPTVTRWEKLKLAWETVNASTLCREDPSKGSGKKGSAKSLNSVAKPRIKPLCSHSHWLRKTCQPYPFGNSGLPRVAHWQLGGPSWGQGRPGKHYLSLVLCVTPEVEKFYPNWKYAH